MRIIAGSRRRLRLKTLEGRDVRPTTDRIKETLFNILQNDAPGSYFLDLFAGSGQIGLEAVSRGAVYAVFVERDKKAAGVIAENIKTTKSEKETLLLQRDVISALRFLEGNYRFDIIFMDPPYGEGMEQETLARLAASSLLKENTLIIVETALKTDFPYLGELGFMMEKEKKYKTNKHVFIRALR